MTTQHLARWVAIAMGLALACGAALAQTTPVGLWKTIDDVSGKEKSLVRITDNSGVLSGKIEKLLDPTTPANELCTKCSDDRKDKPMVGLQIFDGMKKDGDNNVWTGGEILDPANGKTYHLKLTPTNDGKTLDVRGYIGVPLLGRTQTWQRVE